MTQYPKIPSPCFVLELPKLERNLKVIDQVQRSAGIDIIIAFKGFAMWGAFDRVRAIAAGASASSLSEAKLCMEEMHCLAHTYAPAYMPQEFEAIMQCSSHITFNSLSQYAQYRNEVKNFDSHTISCGLRINPEYSVVETELYNPCGKGTRLGISMDELGSHLPEGIEGIHWHNLCESGATDVVATIQQVATKIPHLLHEAKWINMGGGHLMTKEGYDIELLVQTLKDFKAKYGVEVILEPGAAFGWETGFLKSTVLDIVTDADVQTAILDISITCHMPDCLEMPYQPSVIGATPNGKYSYRLGGVSCLAGDFLDGYLFEKPLNIGDEVIFEDMMHYTMVKTTTFNGVHHPSIGQLDKANAFSMIRSFGYEDYKSKLS